MVDNDLCQLFFQYGLALGYLNQEFDNLYDDYAKLGKDNPIEHLKYRIKSVDSIREKLFLKSQIVLASNSILNYEFTASNVKNYVRDVIGYRIVCPFLSDVYKVIDDIKKMSRLIIVEEKDYIENPKKTGYSSYHITVLIPVVMSYKTEYVKAEIQVRTITMDMLASLEHKIYYKKDVVLLEKMKTKLVNTVKFCNYIDKDLDNVLLLEKEKCVCCKDDIVCPDFMNSQEFEEFLEQKAVALRIVEDKINQISNVDGNNLIEHVKCRIKSKSRIALKLLRQNKEVTFDNIKEEVNDIAGIRIVCPFLDDVANVINELKEDRSLNIIQEQDFMGSPKDNGYASYHMLLSVPVDSIDGIIYTNVEIQIRTMPQEMWAILQERLCYQKEVNNQLPDDLKRLSNVLADVDNNMNEMIRYSRRQQFENKRKILSR